VKYVHTFSELVGKTKESAPGETLLLPFPADCPIQTGESVGRLVLLRFPSANVSFNRIEA
jgi:hypothetical protein